MDLRKVSKYANLAGFIAYFLFLFFSFWKGFEPGKKIAFNLGYFSIEMLKILPFAFILIGLFEVWIKKETIEKHFGKKSGLRGHMGGILLAGTTVGGLYVAFPVAYSFYGKGADLGVIFTYIAASAICRIPMTIFEASFLGIKFSIIRLFVSIPLVVISSMLLGKYLTKRGYAIKDGE